MREGEAVRREPVAREPHDLARLDVPLVTWRRSGRTRRSRRRRPASPRRMPSESGRMPLGSRAAKIPSRREDQRASRPRGPPSSASAIAAASVGALERAIRWRITSESEVVVKSAPARLERRPDLPGVDEVAVVRERQRAAAGREDDRLGVGQRARRPPSSTGRARWPCGPAGATGAPRRRRRRRSPSPARRGSRRSSSEAMPADSCPRCWRA